MPIELATVGLILSAASLAATSASIAHQLITGNPSVKPGLRTTTQRVTKRAYRWVLGTARVKGLPIFSRDVDPPGSEYTDLWQVILLSEGSISRIREVYIGGEKVTFDRSGEDGSAKLVGNGKWLHENGNILFEAWERFGADGTIQFPTGPDAPDLTDKVGGVFPDGQPAIQWDEEHTGFGFSAVIIHLRSKVGRRSEPQPVGKKVWRTFPNNLEFVVDGCKLTWPGNSTPTFTRNPMHHIGWILENRAQIDQTVHIPTFNHSVRVCDEDVTYTDDQLPPEYQAAGYDKTTKRYESGCIMEAGTEEETYKQLLLACAGRADIAGGLLYLRAGEPPDFTNAPLLRVPEDTVKQFPSFIPGLPEEERVNIITSRLQQDENNNWTPQSMRDIEDGPAMERDRKRYPHDMGELKCVQNKIQAARIGTILARQLARGTAGFGYHAKAGLDMERLGWLPGTGIIVNNPLDGLADARQVIERLQFDAAMEPLIESSEWEPTTYDDTLILPELEPRDIDFMAPFDAVMPFPTNFKGDAVAVGRDKKKLQPILGIKFSWDDPSTALVDHTLIQYRLRRAGETGPPSEWVESELEVCIAPHTPYICLDQNMAKGEVYDCRARHVSHDGVGSQWSSVITVTVGGDLTPMARPSGLGVDSLITGLRVYWGHPSESDYKHTEIYLRVGVSQSWPTKPHAIIKGSEISLTNLIPATYFVRIRHVDTSDNLSDWSDVVQGTPDPQVEIPDIHPTPADYLYGIPFTSYQSSLSVIDFAGEWYLSGKNEDGWPKNPTFRGYVPQIYQNRALDLKRLVVGQTILIQLDDENWGEYRVNAIFTSAQSNGLIVSSGANLTLRTDRHRGVFNPEVGTPMELRYNATEQPVDRGPRYTIIGPTGRAFWQTNPREGSGAERTIASYLPPNPGPGGIVPVLGDQVLQFEAGTKTNVDTEEFHEIRTWTGTSWDKAEISPSLFVEGNLGVAFNVVADGSISSHIEYDDEGNPVLPLDENGVPFGFYLSEDYVWLPATSVRGKLKADQIESDVFNVQLLKSFETGLPMGNSFKTVPLDFAVPERTISLRLVYSDAVSRRTMFCASEIPINQVSTGTAGTRPSDAKRVYFPSTEGAEFFIWVDANKKSLYFEHDKRSIDVELYEVWAIRRPAVANDPTQVGDQEPKLPTIENTSARQKDTVRRQIRLIQAGDPPHSWSVEVVSGPSATIAGLTISDNGEFSVRIPDNQAVGAYGIRVTVTDDDGDKDTKDFRLTIAKGVDVPEPQFSSIPGISVARASDSQRSATLSRYLRNRPRNEDGTLADVVFSVTANPSSGDFLADIVGDNADIIKVSRGFPTENAARGTVTLYAYYILEGVSGSEGSTNVSVTVANRPVAPDAPIWRSQGNLNIGTGNSATRNMRNELIGVPAGVTIQYSFSTRSRDINFTGSSSSTGRLTVNRRTTQSGSVTVTVTARYLNQGIPGEASSVDITVTFSAQVQAPVWTGTPGNVACNDRYPVTVGGLNWGSLDFSSILRNATHISGSAVATGPFNPGRADISTSGLIMTLNFRSAGVIRVTVTPFNGSVRGSSRSFTICINP